MALLVARLSQQTASGGPVPQRLETTVEIPGETRAVRARAAAGEERDRLWAQFRDYPGWGEDIDGLARQRSAQTAVIVLEPVTLREAS